MSGNRAHSVTRLSLPGSDYSVDGKAVDSSYYNPVSDQRGFAPPPTRMISPLTQLDASEAR